ncbi:dephospho-CoA kinase [Haloechinothrix halophila]|uniref:dephospho-CoA kinase n=1 Tax=Haloechinothrix halophila TaxID=1069073 RepID=UPI0004244ADD|nr:dephospho-CoA kinase [Haloechinothrix halophila]
MLRVGLTGGIGAGKSTVASRLAEHGALLIDADTIARDVVEPGTPGLAAIVAEFGDGVLAEDGSLDRPAMAERVFNDDTARSRLNGIVHPLVGERTAELLATAADDAIVVHDVPLLVENNLAPSYHLVLIVDAPADVRVRRLAESRDMPERDARARIAAQAEERQRRAAADVWLDNSGTPDVVRSEVDALWTERLVPFEANVRLRRPAPWGRTLVEHDPVWQEQARRVLDRIRLVAGERAVRADHVGATAVVDLPARDVLDLQLTVRSAQDVDALAPALTDAGFPLADAVSPVPDAVLHGGADPGRPVSLRVLVDGSPAARRALLLRDWLRADVDARAEYARIKREHADVPGIADTATGAASAAETVGDVRYAEAKRMWFDDVTAKADRWAAETGWTP